MMPDKGRRRQNINTIEIPITHATHRRILIVRFVAFTADKKKTNRRRDENVWPVNWITVFGFNCFFYVIYMRHKLPSLNFIANKKKRRYVRFQTRIQSNCYWKFIVCGSNSLQPPYTERQNEGVENENERTQKSYIIVYWHWHSFGALVFPIVIRVKIIQAMLESWMLNAELKFVLIIARARTKQNAIEW